MEIWEKFRCQGSCVTYLDFTFDVCKTHEEFRAWKQYDGICIMNVSYCKVENNWGQVKTECKRALKLGVVGLFPRDGGALIR